MRKMSKAISLLLCAGVLAGCTACSGNPESSTDSSQNSSVAETSSEPGTGEQVEIKFAYFGGVADQTRFETNMAGGIEEALPHIKVSFQMYASDQEFYTAVPVALAAGTGPDIFTDEPTLEYINNGVISELDSYLNEVGFDLEEYSKTARDGCQYDGKTYAVPYSTSVSALAVNMDMLNAAGIESVPKTTEELKAAAKAMTKDGVYGLCIWPTEHHLSQYIHAFGGDWGYGKTINSPENVEGLQFVVDLFKEGCAVTPNQVGSSWDGEAFANGLVGMSTGGNWYLGAVEGVNPNLNFELVPVPGDENGVETTQVGTLLMSESCNHKKEAAEVMKYMVSPENLKNNIELGDVPSTDDLRVQAMEATPALDALFSVSDEIGRPFAYPEKKKEFAAALGSGMEDIIFRGDDGNTVEELLETLQAEYGQ